jgi:hypothetical protein
LYLLLNSHIYSTITEPHSRSSARASIAREILFCRHHIRATTMGRTVRAQRSSARLSCNTLA